MQILRPRSRSVKEDDVRFPVWCGGDNSEFRGIVTSRYA
jgi:hypothetical protein